MPDISLEIRRKCKICGKVFLVKKLDSQYCSAKCSKIAYKRKCDAEKKETRLQKIASQVPKIREYISVKEAVAIFGVERDSVYRLVRSGKVNSVNLGKRLIRINRKDMEYHPPEARGMPPVRPEDFECWRSQAWWQLRCDLEAGNIDLSPLRAIPAWSLLVKEVMAHQMSRHNGKIRITPKEKLRDKDVLGWSPGRAVALVAWNWVRRRVMYFASAIQ